MKLSKALILGAAVASVASLAQAQTKIYITGSTAFRNSTAQAIIDLFDSAPHEADDKGGGNLGAGHQIYYGSIGGSAFIVKTSWSGSAAGVQTVSQGIAQNFIPDAGTNAAAGNYTGSVNDSEIPNIAMSDVNQSSTPFTSPALTEDANGAVGVIPFYFVRNHGSSSSIANMTPQIARTLWSLVGSCPLALFTGLNADEGTVVYATGRNPDSGTRITAFAESGVGVLSPVGQFQQTITGANGSGTIQSVHLWPTDTVNGIHLAVGRSGESSGGTLALDMENNANGFNMVTYLGETDANSLFNAASEGSALQLKYNGVAFSRLAIEEGQYTFWGYEHVYYLSSGFSSFADSLQNKIATVTAGPSGLAGGLDAAHASGVFLSDMQVGRNSDGGTVTANYF